MQGIVQANIDRFNRLLKTEIDPAKRAMIFRLLAEEKEKLKAMPKSVSTATGAPSLNFRASIAMPPPS